jgi:heparanase 1
MSKTPNIVMNAFLAATLAATPTPRTTAVMPDKMPRIATVNERYQSYNIEMAELTGGQFWIPYEQMPTPPKSPAKAGVVDLQSSGADFYARLKKPLKPTDLYNPELRKLAAALGPAYVRSSGNVADAVYFHDSDAPPPANAPKGYKSILTRQEWKGLIDFARTVNGRVVTSFAISAGTRDANGHWTPDQARKLIDYTKSVGEEITAAEFFNEPTLGPQGIGGLPPDYTAADFARDFAIFRPFAKQAAPNMLILGPSATGEGPVKLLSGKLIKTADLLSATPRPIFDAFSYHAYSASSIRCKAPGKLTTTADAALTEEWLGRTDQTYAFYAALRDRYEPGKPIWITETSESSCGGDPWAKTFLDTFRYLDQLGRLAKHGVQTVMHNTLAVSEYSLIDGNTMQPRPNYWAALLWRRLMSTTVLDADVPLREGLHLYAQCLPGKPGGVTLLAINNSRTESESIDLRVAAQRYTLTAKDLQNEQVELNGHALKLQSNGDLPPLEGQQIHAGNVVFAPVTITFLAVAEAGNASCR